MTPFTAFSWKAALLVFSGLSSPGQMLSYSSSLPSRFVVIPRHANAKHKEIRFFDTEPFHVSVVARGVQRAPLKVVNLGIGLRVRARVSLVLLAVSTVYSYS